MGSSGEAFITIGGSGGWGPELLTEAELAVILKRVGKELGDAGADITVLRERKIPSNTEAVGMATELSCSHAVPVLNSNVFWLPVGFCCRCVLRLLWSAVMSCHGGKQWQQP